MAPLEENHLIDVRALATALGRPLCRALLSYHALTGCDTVSAFSGRGKKDGFFILKEDLKEDKVYCQNLSQLGNTIDITADTKEKVETFVCRLYGYHCDSADVLRHELFTKPLSKKKGPPETQNMPPTSDALGKHILRANYQTYIWKNAMNADIEVSLPGGHGWLMSDGQLIIDWMDNDPAPLSVLENISCACKKDCGSNQCSCKKVGLKCTDACRCSDDCVNTRATTDGDTDSDDSGDELNSDETQEEDMGTDY